MSTILAPEEPLPSRRKPVWWVVLFFLFILGIGLYLLAVLLESHGRWHPLPLITGGVLVSVSYHFGKYLRGKR